ncbi:MAG: ACP phosphodiesterase [Thermoflexibacter sp.]|jgi:acyl carrier protein phosphodiesterase|nr:ACP phosphodiesterase [Thermoflexibacter sp.]
MNFLAHAYLSGQNEEILIGNFIADHVKGKQFLQYSEGIAKGIQLHRRIDAFTDQHPIVKKSKARLQTSHRHYAGVVVDIFYDHFLAANWTKYHQENLSIYSQKVHQTISKYQEILPQKSSYFFQYMLKNQIFEIYAQIDGIHKVLTGMSKRTPFESGMEHASRNLIDFYQDFHAEFEEFFPLLINDTKLNTLEDLGSL